MIIIIIVPIYKVSIWRVGKMLKYWDKKTIQKNSNILKLKILKM